MEAILAGSIEPGTVVVIRYEGPKGGPGMREMLAVTGAMKGVGRGADCALVTDGRFSGGHPRLLHRPRRARGGRRRADRRGRGRRPDRRSTWPPTRSTCCVDDAELARRRQRVKASEPRATRPACSPSTPGSSPAPSGGATEPSRRAVATWNDLLSR